MQICFKKYFTRYEKFLERSQITEKHEVRALSWICFFSAHLLRWITVIGCLREDLTNYQHLLTFCRKRSRGCGRAGRSPGRMCHSLFRGHPLALNASVFFAGTFTRKRNVFELHLYDNWPECRFKNAPKIPRFCIGGVRLRSFYRTVMALSGFLM